MDSSINKTEQIVDTDTFVNTNLNLFSNILNSYVLNIFSRSHELASKISNLILVWK